MCHVVWLLPILGLPLFWVLDFSLALPLYIGLLALSGGVLLLSIQSLRKPASSGIEGMRGGVAEVVEALRPRGTVRYHNTFWYAMAQEPIAVGETVRIVGNKGVCLVVERLTQVPISPCGTGSAPDVDRLERYPSFRVRYRATQASLR